MRSNSGWTRIRWMGSAVSILALVASACGGNGGTGGDGALKKLSGSVSADGSSTVYPITQAIAEEFNRAAPNVKVTVGFAGTGGGFKKLCAGNLDLSDASRPIKDSEKATCAKNAVEYTELQVATDGLSLLVNRKNTWVDCLTTAELKKVWEPAAKGKITNWRQIRAGFPNEPLKLYGPGTDSGTFDYFTDQINGKEGASRSDFNASENDNDLVTGVAGDEGALGYFGYAYYVENKDKLKVLGVDPGTGCVKPSEETINSGTYKPLSRPLLIYVAKKAAARAEIKAFVDFYLEYAHELVGDVGYVAVNEDARSKAQAAWDSFKA